MPRERRDRYGELLVDSEDQVPTLATIHPFRRRNPAARSARLQLRAKAQTVSCRQCGATVDQPCTRPGHGGPIALEHMDHTRRLRDALAAAHTSTHRQSPVDREEGS